MSGTSLIVVGVDGSEPAKRALDWAVADAARRTHAGQQTSVQAVTSWWFDPLAEPESAAVRLPDPREAADRKLSHAIALARTEQTGVAISGEVVEGSPAEVLTRASSDADLLILGSHGHSQTFHAALGSVAEECVRKASCPVVVIPATRAAATVTTDGSRPATAAEPGT